MTSLNAAIWRRVKSSESGIFRCGKMRANAGKTHRAGAADSLRQAERNLGSNAQAMHPGINFQMDIQHAAASGQ